MSISAPFVRRPIATSLLMGGIFLVGLVVYPLLPVAPLPQVDFPTVQVSASLPGASPETMASSVATPLEYQFAQISGLSQMTSTNVLGNTQITLQFDLNKNIDAAAQAVQTSIDAAGRELLARETDGTKFRLIGIGVSALAGAEDADPADLVDHRGQRTAAAEHAVDRLREKFGRAAVIRGIAFGEDEAAD